MPDILIWVDILDSNGWNRNDIFEWISRKFMSTQSNLTQLATDTVCGHSSGEESVPQVLSTYITVSHRHHCNCAVMSLSIVSSSCPSGCVRHASHLCPVFSFSPSPPFYFFSLCVGWEGESWSARGWRQVVGRSCLIDTLSVCFFVCPCFCVDVVA